MGLYVDSSFLNAMVFLLLFLFSSSSYSYTKTEIIMHFESNESNATDRAKSSQELYLKGMIEGIQRYNLMKGILCSDVEPRNIIPIIKKIDAESLFISVYFALLFDHCEDDLKKQNEFFEKKIVPLLD